MTSSLREPNLVTDDRSRSSAVERGLPELQAVLCEWREISNWVHFDFGKESLRG